MQLRIEFRFQDFLELTLEKVPTCANSNTAKVTMLSNQFSRSHRKPETVKKSVPIRAVTNFQLLIFGTNFRNEIWQKIIKIRNGRQIGK
jgi:hypothetical protein